jgi:hypothetical protein
MSYSRGIGDDVGPGSCPPGEEFDATSLQCVTAGQAITPVPAGVNVQFQPPAGAGSGSGVSTAQASTSSDVSAALPYVVAGALVLGIGFLVAR